jgi:hypothetical protein
MPANTDAQNATVSAIIGTVLETVVTLAGHLSRIEHPLTPFDQCTNSLFV